jgi:prepilin-type processing-associated H-X9-DG protein
MPMRPSFIIYVCAGMCFLSMSTACRLSQTSFDRNRSQCQRNMRSIEVAVKEFPYDHSGDRPRTLDDALSNIGFADAERSAEILRCPGITSVTASGDLESRTGYHYVDWSRWFGRTNVVPAFYPLIYDLSIHNHDGRGINIVFVDGSIIWDEGAKTLRDFSFKHPEYKLPLPQ